ncbi:hypothetical protein AAG570_001645 [Ranatra chinensis]|uniref:Dynein light chain n=1 Tax=Ranatra chinensis TaxID=642074 RepID=A0ABD0Y962_9HEMI
MASKRRDMFHKNEKQETTENGPNMTECKEAIECADMSADMQKDAVNCAKQAMEEFNVEKKRNTFPRPDILERMNVTILRVNSGQSQDALRLDDGLNDLQAVEVGYATLGLKWHSKSLENG